MSIGETMTLTCNMCKRKIQLSKHWGRCECGQVWVRRGKKAVRLNEWPKDCIQGIPAAETVEQAEVQPEQQAAPTRKRSQYSALQAAEKVLADTEKVLTVEQLTEAMLKAGLWSTTGKTPAATVYSAILRDIHKKGPRSAFCKAGPNTFLLRD